tara:strand:- start:253 stop:1002 length:750 start_codon:yes stop_codon:yes gene_type:complete
MKFFYKLIYEIICFVYSRVLTVLENSFLRITVKTKSTLNRDGYLKISKKRKLNVSKHRFDFILNEHEISFFSSNYQKKFILSQDNLNSIVKIIFDREFCNFLTSQTGFKYSIDFFGAYQNFPIPKELIDKSWYANHYHFDKPNSKNMLKVFIPMKKIGINDGPLELIDINKKKQYLVGGFGDIFLCKLNICLHKAGVPKEGSKTNLIMIQLNPSKNWYLNANLYQRQFKREPKFTTLINKFVGRVLLNK